MCPVNACWTLVLLDSIPNSLRFRTFKSSLVLPKKCFYVYLTQNIHISYFLTHPLTGHCLKLLLDRDCLVSAPVLGELNIFVCLFDLEHQTLSINDRDPMPKLLSASFYSSSPYIHLTACYIFS